MVCGCLGETRCSYFFVHPHWPTLGRLMFVLAGGFQLAPLSGATSPARRLEAIYEPFHTEAAALAPDGRHVAFALRERGELRVVIRDAGLVAPPVGPRLEWPAGARLEFFQWANATQLVLATSAPAVFAIDATTGTATVLATAKTLRPRPEFAGAGGPMVRVVGFARQPDSVVLEVSGARPDDAAPEAIRIDLRTAGRVAAAVDAPLAPRGRLLADRQGTPRIVRRASDPQVFYARLPGNARTAWKPLDEIVADPAGRAFRVSARNFLGPRALPLGFADDPNLLYFASNVGRDKFGIYALDLPSGKRTAFAVEDADFDLADLNWPTAETTLVVDRARGNLAGLRAPGRSPAARWLDAEIGKVQKSLDEKFPGRSVEVIEWDAAREQFLVLVAGGDDPGRYFIFHRGDGRCVEFFRRGEMNLDDEGRTEPFEVEVVDGTRITGYLTRPAAPAENRPLIVWFHDGPWQRVTGAFNRDVQALAAMGFAVAQLNYRGSAGFGRRFTEALRGGFDRGPVDDALAVLAQLQARDGIDRGRIAAGGEGFGGYLALRAAQLHPDIFRGVVAIDAPLGVEPPGDADDGDSLRQRQAELDFSASDRRARTAADSPGADVPEEIAPREFVRGTSDLSARAERPPAPETFEREVWREFFAPGRADKFSVAAQAELLTRPALLLYDARSTAWPATAVKEFRSELARRKQPAEFGEISPAAMAGSGGARAELFRRIGEFLKTALSTTAQPE